MPNLKKVLQYSLTIINLTLNKIIRKVPRTRHEMELFIRGPKQIKMVK